MAYEYWVCPDDTKIVGNCFKVHGRISIYNGNPSIRIWIVGTNRLLGMRNAEISSEILNAYLKINTHIYGDFIVCPLTQFEKGTMQNICLKSGKNLVIEQFSTETQKFETFKLKETWDK